MKIISIFLLITLNLNVVYAANYKLNFSLIPIRKTYIRKEGNLLKKNNDHLGLSLGAETLWEPNSDIRLGLGFEIKSKVRYDFFFNGKDNSYYSTPIYGIVNYELPDNFYIFSRLGVSLNKGEMVTKIGKYLGLGIGKRIKNYDLSLLIESSELVKSKNILVLNKNFYNSGLFFDGALDQVSLKIGYTFGKGNKGHHHVEAISEETQMPIITIEDTVPVFTSTQIPNIKVFMNKNINILYSYRVEKISPYEDLGTSSITNSNEYTIKKDLKDGKYRITVTTYTDKKISTIYKDFIIDTTPPKIKINSNIDKNNVTWNWSLDDLEGKVTEVRLNGVKVNTENQSYSTSLIDGNYNLMVKSQDQYKNENTIYDTVVINSKEITKPIIEKKVIESFIKGIISIPVINNYNIKITSLNKVQKEIIYEVLAALKGKKGILKIIGYTDSIGSERQNLKISKNRADNVADIVKRMSNNKDLTLETIGRGKTNFKYNNNSEKYRKLNRRIEFEFSEKSDD